MNATSFAGSIKELSVYIKQLAATLEIGEDGKPSLISKLADPRFQKPFSGLYWQIEDDKKPVLHSRSLWDQTLALPPFNVKHPAPARREIIGPEDEMLIIRTRVIFFETSWRRSPVSPFCGHQQELKSVPPLRNFHAI